MDQDKGWKVLFSDDERFADLVNGYACGGAQILRGSDLQELDTQTGFFQGAKLFQRLSPGRRAGKVKIRDMVRKAAFGMNFAIIGIENQELIDYSIPLRNMTYDVGEYEKQAAKLRKAIRKEHSWSDRGEYLYGFCKDSRLYPVVTCILYAGEKEWDGPRSLREMLDFAGIPEDLQELIQDYRINLIEIRKLQDTNVFQTDIRQVFDFIRCAGDKNALKELTQNDPAFRSMEEDAFDVMVQYANVPELVGIKDDYGKEGKIDMCKGLADWIAEEREAGIETGRETGRQEGLQEGRREGLQEGRREGRQEGREESRNETIQNMLAADIDVAIILKAGFTMEEIEKAGGQKKER